MDKAQERRTEQEVEKSNTKGPMAMAHLDWVASELGSATGFPKTNIIPQKPQPDERRACCLEAATQIRMVAGT
jgi:hypothetical protein